VIPGEAHPQTAVVWAISADPALDGLSPVAWADGGRDPDRLLAIARRDGTRAGGEPDPDAAASALDAIPGEPDRPAERTEQVERREAVPLDPLDDADATDPRRAGSDPWLAAIRHALAHGPADPGRPDREAREVLALTLTPAGVDRLFALPSHHLDGRTPSDVLADDPRAVLRAACDLAFGDG
jgi:hypothetical protein